MYGQPEIPRPEHMKERDDAFIKKAITGFNGDRKEASKAWASVAEEFFRNGNLHYAIRRYNQAWLLDPENYLAYWGFGQIKLARDELDASISNFEKAKSLINDPYQEPALQSDTGSAYTYKAMSIPGEFAEEKARYFEISFQHFRKSSELDPAYSFAYKRWAIALYESGKYAETWEKVKKAESLNEPISEKFLALLREKMPEPL